MNRPRMYPIGGLCTGVLCALVLAAAGSVTAATRPAPSGVSAASATPAAPVHVPWTVRHELNRAEAQLRRDSARLSSDGDVQVLRDSETVVLRVPARLLFSPDSEMLRPGLRAAEMLAVPTTLLRRRRHLMTRVEVYTDNIGGLQMNEDLSARRAASLAAALLSAGISAHRVQALGHGAAQALSSNDTPEGRILNRRVEFVFARLGSHAALEPAPPAPTPAAPQVGAAAPGTGAALRPASAAGLAGG